MAAPYQLASYLGTNITYFQTDRQINYYCRVHNHTNNLSPIIGIYDIEVYELEFYSEDSNEKKRKEDNRVKATFYKIVNEYFAKSKNRVLVYICDAIDGKQKARNVLFERWYKQHMQDYLERIPVVIELSEEHELIYACVLTRRDFEHPHILKTELIDEAKGIVSNKYGQ